MGGFLFLRYICPSILAPHLCGLLDGTSLKKKALKKMAHVIPFLEPPLPTAQRQLILVAKVVQNLSNNTLPGAKEAYMQRLNDFITNNQTDLQAFFDEILVRRSFSLFSIFLCFFFLFLMRFFFLFLMLFFFLFSSTHL